MTAAEGVVIVNSTATDALATGSALIDAGGFEFAFPFATRARPSAQLVVHAGCRDAAADGAGAVFACHPDARFARGAIRLVDVTGGDTFVLVPSP